MIVLALDVALNTGVAVDGRSPGVPHLSTLHFSAAASQPDGGLNYGRLYEALESRLLRLIMSHKPDFIAFESPLPVVGFSTAARKFKTTSHTVRQLHGMVSVVELIAARRGVQCGERTPQEIKAHFAGHRSADKVAMMHRCRSMRWHARNDNEADAAGLWSLVKAELDPKFRPVAGPLSDTHDGSELCL